MGKNEKKAVYAFIDSQNLHIGVSKDIRKNGNIIYKGWRLDFKKFRKYLFDKYRVTKAFLFIGYLTEHKSMYKMLQTFGFEIIFKPTVRDSGGKPKGNVDTELVLYSAAIEYTHYDQAIVVSGDGDFYCLHEYLVQKKKLLKILIPNKKSESSLLKKFHSRKVFIERERSKLELKP